MSTHSYAIRVLPAAARDTALNAERCIYTVSLGAANRTLKEILDGYRWTVAAFPRVGVLIGDSLYATTLQIQQGLAEREASREAFMEADRIVAALDSDAGVQELIRTSRLQGNPAFQSACVEVMRAYDQVSQFSASINEDAASFVRRQAIRQTLRMTVPEATALARTYLLEEVALFGYLAQQGWPQDAYLGDELPTLARMIRGKVPAVIPELGSRLNIALQRRPA
jgi:tRNA-dependent cyclodipeptide synthase